MIHEYFMINSYYDSVCHYLRFIEINDSLASQFPPCVLTLVRRRRRSNELESRLEVERLRIVVARHVNGREVHFELAAVRDVCNWQCGHARRVAHAIPNENHGIVPRTLVDLQLCRIVAVAERAIRVILHPGVARSISCHHSVHDDFHSLASLSFKAINTTEWRKRERESVLSMIRFEKGAKSGARSFLSPREDIYERHTHMSRVFAFSLLTLNLLHRSVQKRRRCECSER
jgi:hypothetical protein